MNPTPGEHDFDRAPVGDAEDAALDANLRAIGARVGRVPAPTRDQLAAWRSGPVESSAPLRLSDAPARPVRRSRWLAAGSAIAACIAVAGVVLIQPWGSQVQASTIIQNLRQRAFGGVNIRFDHLSSQGTTIDGVMRIRLSHPISLDRLEEEAGRPRTPEEKREQFGAAWGSFVLTTDESPQAWPGLSGARIQVEGALTHASGWMFVQAPDKTAKQIAQAEPRAAMLAQLAGSGVLLNVGGVDESFFEGLNAMVCPDMQGAHAGLHARIGSLPDGQRGLSIGASSPVPGHPSREQVQRFVSLARMVLSGKARQEELEQLRSLIQNDFSQRATVQKLGGDAYLLTTGVADPDHPSSDGKPDATLTVHYEEQGGVQWAELSDIRDATGSIRIDFDTDPIDPKLLAYDRLVETGKTNYIDLRQVMKLLMPPKASETEPSPRR